VKKKLLTIAVMTALTVSTASVYAAAPTFSGDANIEYRNQDGGGDYLTNRIRLNVDSQIDDTFYIHGRMRMDNDLRNGNADNKTSFDQAYLGAKVGQVDVRAGKQSLAIGKGLLMDDDKFTGAHLATVVEGVKLNGFTGKDPANVNTSYGDVSTTWGNVNVGATYLYEGDHYYAVNADTKLTDNVVLNVEYAKNSTTEKNGYLAEVVVGNAVKKGDMKYSLSYRDIDASAIPDFTTDGWYKDSKGFRIKGAYKVSDAATLTAYQDLGEAQNGDDHKRTNVEFAVTF